MIFHRRKTTGKVKGVQSDAPMQGHVSQWEELVVDYVDGRLDPSVRDTIEAHLSSCPECAALVQRQHETATLLRAVPQVPPPPEIAERVFEALLEPQSSPDVDSALGATRDSAAAREESPWTRIWRNTVRPWAPAAVAVIALLLGIVGYGLLRTGAQEQIPLPSQTVASASINEGPAQTRQAEEQARYKTASDATTALGQASLSGTENLQPELATSPFAAQQGPDDTDAADAGTSEPVASGAGTTAGTSTTRWADTVTSPEMETTTTLVAGTPSSVTTYLPQTTATLGDQMGSRSATFAVTSREDMLSTLESATGPVYFVFTSDPDGARATEEKAAAMAGQLYTLLGLAPADVSLVAGSPALAAYLPREDAPPFVDLLLSVATSLDLSLVLDPHPVEADSPAGHALLEHRADFPEVSAHRAPAPGITGWSFSTSPTVPGTDYLLVIIFTRY